MKPRAPAPSELRWLPDDVVAIGSPRARIGRNELIGTIALTADRKLVLADADGWVTAWDATTGTVHQEIGPENDDDPHSMSLAVSADGRWLAVGSSQRVRVLAAPFTDVSFTASCYSALAFSHDSKLLACGKAAPELWSVDGHHVVQATAAPHGPRAAVFSDDDHSLVYATQTEIVRWTFAPASAVASIYKSSGPHDVAFAANGKLAYVGQLDRKTFKWSGKLVDLTTGSATDVPIGGPGALSPSGTRVAIVLPTQVRVLDTKSLQQVWTAKVASPVRYLAFDVNDDMLVYRDANDLRIANLPAAPTEFAATDRFAGWIAEGVVAIERGTALSRLSLADRSTGPAERSAVLRASGSTLDLTPSRALVETFRMDVERPQMEKTEFEHHLTAGAIGPSLVALVSEGPMLDMAADPEPECVSTLAVDCRHEWLLSLWDTAKEQLLWRFTLTDKTDHVHAGEATGSLEIDHAGKNVIVGFEDGEIRVYSTDNQHAMRSVRLHHHRIVRLSVSPRDGWVFSEDASGEQRIWRL